VKNRLNTEIRTRGTLSPSPGHAVSHEAFSVSGVDKTAAGCYIAAEGSGRSIEYRREGGFSGTAVAAASARLPGQHPYTGPETTTE
jgi:hypothetical protein